MTHSENWNAFINEFRAYVLEHHHYPNKHMNLLSRVKYTRKKINDGTLEVWKKEQFLEVANMRDMEEHTGGRKKKIEMNLGKQLFNEIAKKAAESPRLRMNYDLRNDGNEQSQRMLNRWSSERRGRTCSHYPES